VREGSIMTLMLLILSVLATGGAVVYGVLAFRADRRAAPADTWSAAARTEPIYQADRLREGMRRELARRAARARTYISGTWWLSASMFATASSLTALNQIIAESLAIVLAFLAIGQHIWSAVDSRRWRASRVHRIERVAELEAKSRQSSQSEMSVEQQLLEWADNPDLRVFLMVKHEGGLVTTSQGVLILQKTGVGGWALRPTDWDLGPTDSTSVVRGVALNLHFYESPRWSAGNDRFGASCQFARKATIPDFLADGRVIGLRGIVETVTLRIDDPFEIMPFLGSINQKLAEAKPGGGSSTI
jgi:hypothetical protein